MTLTQDSFTATLPQELWTSEQVRLNEANAAAATGVSMPMLMEHSGQAAFSLLKELWPKARSILVLAGKGNNGGDAFTLALLAKKDGYLIQLIQLDASAEMPSIAADAKARWLDSGGVVERPEQANLHLDIIVDGLLGTGLKGSVKDDYAQLIDRCNFSASPTLAIDIPSGLNADTGSVHTTAIIADACITFVGVKQGLCNGRAEDYCGDLYFSGLGIDKAFNRQGKSDKKRITYENLSHLLGPRNRNAHKGDFGHAALVGGNQGMPGAIRLASEACLRGGVGLISVLTHSENRGIICSGRPELMVFGLQDPDAQTINKAVALMDKATVVAAGPGLGSNPWSVCLMKAVIGQNKAKVIDADALNYLAAHPSKYHNWILTPHPGEAARLLGISIVEVESDRYRAVKLLQERFGGVIVLKGSGTLICSDESLFVANVGNPGMASGGMGDLLCGLIAALLAQGLSLLDAASLGVCIHGNAADIAAKQGERGMLASDLLPHLRQLVNS